MTDQVIVQHRFTITEANGLSFTDAIVLPESEYQQLTPEQLEAIKQERFASWKKQIIEATVVTEPTAEEKISLIDQDLAIIEETKQALLEQKSQLESGGTREGFREVE